MKTDARTPSNWSRRFKNHIEKLKSGDIYQVAEVVRNLSSRDGDKGLSAGEKRMLSQARNILTSELSYALDLDREGAEETLNKVLNKEDVSDVIAAKKKAARAAKKEKAAKKKAQEAKKKEREAAKKKAAPKKTAKKTAKASTKKEPVKKSATKKTAAKTTAKKATKKTTAKKK